jgi:hypothetical protein
MLHYAHTPCFIFGVNYEQMTHINAAFEYGGHLFELSEDCTTIPIYCTNIHTK